jgi:hypothetical protein
VTASKPLRIDLVRSGGFAGLETTVSLDAATLPREEADELGRLVDRADLPRHPRPPGPPPSGADRFQYDLAIVRGDERRTASLTEADLTPELRKLVRRVLELGRR